MEEQDTRREEDYVFDWKQSLLCNLGWLTMFAFGTFFLVSLLNVVATLGDQKLVLLGTLASAFAFLRFFHYLRAPTIRLKYNVKCMIGNKE